MAHVTQLATIPGVLMPFVTAPSAQRETSIYPGQLMVHNGELDIDGNAGTFDVKVTFTLPADKVWVLNSFSCTYHDDEDAGSPNDFETCMIRYFYGAPGLSKSLGYWPVFIGNTNRIWDGVATNGLQYRNMVLGVGNGTSQLNGQMGMTGLEGINSPAKLPIVGGGGNGEDPMMWLGYDTATTVPDTEKLIYNMTWLGYTIEQCYNAAIYTQFGVK